MPNRPGRGSAVGRTIWRTALLLVVSLLVAGATGAVEGRPSSARARLDRGAPYGPTFPLGAVQLFGQGALFAAGVTVARRWLRVRL